MRRTLVVLVLAALAHAEERAFLETVTARQTYYVHEPIRLRLRIGIDTRFLETNVVQTFQQRFDLPVQVDAPWLGELNGAATTFTVRDTPFSSGAWYGRAVRYKSVTGWDTGTEQRLLEPTNPTEFAVLAFVADEADG